MRIRSLGAVAASAALVLIVGASAVAAAPSMPVRLADDAGFAYVRVLDAMIGQPALDVYVTRVAVDTPPTYPAVKYGTWTGYQQMYFTPDCVGMAVCKLEFQMAVPGETKAFKTDDLAFRQNNYYTVALASTGSTGPNFIVVRETMTKPLSSSLRFGNLTSDVTKTLDFSAIRMTKSAGPSSASAQDVAYAKVTLIRPVTAGPWNVQFGVHGSMYMARAVKNATLNGARRYTAYAIGEIGGTDTYAAKFILVPNR
jgi:hypothetical protein